MRGQKLYFRIVWVFKFYTIVKKNSKKLTFQTVVTPTKDCSPKRHFFTILFHYAVKFKYL